jgi:hypothetical protein
MKTFLSVAFFLLAGLAQAASIAPSGSSPESPTQGASSDPVGQIPATLMALEKAKAGDYGKLRAEDKQMLDSADREIAQLLAEHDDLNALDEQEKMRLFNAQESVMAIVSGLKRSQLVCTYRANAGTRFKTKHCITREMAEAVRKAGKDTTNNVQNPMCVPGEGSSCSR